MFSGELFIAGERIRTADVQLGKLGPALPDWLSKPVFSVYLSVIRGFRNPSHSVAF